MRPMLTCICYLLKIACIPNYMTKLHVYFHQNKCKIAIYVTRKCIDYKKIKLKTFVSKNKFFRGTKPA